MGLWDKYAKEAADNDFAVAQGGAPEGWLGAEVNTWARNCMSELRQFAERQEWIWPLDDVDNDRVAQPTGNHGYTVSKVSDTEIQIAALGSSAITIAKKYFVKGRRCRIVTTTVSVDATIVSTSDNTVDLNIVVEAIEGNSGAIPTNPTDIGVYMVDPTEAAANGVILFSGVGTTAERDAKFESSFTDASDMILWYNTTNKRLEVAADGGWVDFLDLYKPILSSTSSDTVARALEQTILQGLVSTNGRLMAPELAASVSATKRLGVTHNGTDVLLTLYDTDGSTKLAEWKFKSGDGTLEVDDQGGAGFVSIFGARVYSQRTTDQNLSASPEDDAQLTALAITGADGSKTYRVSFYATTGGDIDKARIHVGANGTSADAIVCEVEVAEVGTSRKAMSMSGFVITPASGDKIGVSWERLGTSDDIVYGNLAADKSKLTFLEVQEIK